MYTLININKMYKLTRGKAPLVINKTNEKKETIFKLRKFLFIFYIFLKRKVEK